MILQCGLALCTMYPAALLLAPLTALRAADLPAPPGDRNLPINQVYPPDAFYHNGKGGRVLDVTKPPFNAKGGADGPWLRRSLLARLGYARTVWLPVTLKGKGEMEIRWRDAWDMSVFDQ